MVPIRGNNRSCEFHLLGFLTGGFGLGESARHTLRRLNQLNIPITAKEVDSGDHRMGQIEEFKAQLEPRRNYWPGNINLFHLNPPEAAQLWTYQYPSIPLINRFNVIVPFWELPELPPEWSPILDGMDCILAPSLFIEDIIRKNYPDKLILHYPQCIPAAELGEADRPGFDFPEDAFIFLCAFDVMSDVERKNPWAAITAFKKAFPTSQNVRLVVKASNAHMFGVLERLREAVKGDSRILILSERLSHQKLQSLYASCDALVSLHRSEGLGLFIMEMMTQAKPVIVTAWSGNMDYTTPANACLVKADMVPVHSTHPAYAYAESQPNLYWADADTDAAAEWMVKLAADPELCRRLGQEARKDMMERASMDCSETFETIQSHARAGWSRSRQAQERFRKLRRRHQAQRIERLAKKIFRRKKTGKSKEAKTS